MHAQRGGPCDILAFSQALELRPADERTKDVLLMKLLPCSSALPILVALIGLVMPARAQEIVVGEFASLTGSEATFGVNSSNGVQLAVDEINNSGGLLGGRKIKIVIEDDQ